MENNPMMDALLKTQEEPKDPTQALIERIAATQERALSGQRKGIEATQARLDKLQSGPKKKDMSALFAMGDMLGGGGGQYSKMYQAMKPKDTKNEQLQLEMLLSRQRMGLADDELNFLKTQLKSKNADLESLTPGQKKVDQEFGKEYSHFFLEGGLADAEKGLEQLRDVSSKLGSYDAKGNFLPNKDITGGLKGWVPPGGRIAFNEESANAQQAVEEVVQRNLRVILGAQFTEKEGVRLIERAYNPKSSERENKKRVDRLIKAMSGALKAKKAAGEYYEEYGTLKKYKGTSRLSKSQAKSFVDDLIKEVEGSDSSTPKEDVFQEWEGKSYKQVGDKWVEVK